MMKNIASEIPKLINVNEKLKYNLKFTEIPRISGIQCFFKTQSKF